MTPRTSRTVHVALAVPAALLMLAGCGAPDRGAAAGDGDPATATSAPASAGAGGTGGKATTTVTGTVGGGGSGGGDGADCSARTAEEAMAAHVDSIPANPVGGGWRYYDDDYDTCSPLSYILLAQEHIGNSQFAMKLMLFHEGGYLGVDTTTPQQVQSITREGDELRVVYRDWRALAESGEPNVAAPKYRKEVVLYWDGAKVGHRGDFPDHS